MRHGSIWIGMLGLLLACGSGPGSEADSDQLNPGDLSAYEIVHPDSSPADASKDTTPLDLADVTSETGRVSDVGETSRSTDLEQEVAPKPTSALEAFEQVLELGNALALEALLESWEGPVCEEGVCLVLTAVPGASSVAIRGEFNDWAEEQMTRVEFYPDAWYHMVDADFEHWSEYKLFADDEWMRDPVNPCIRFSDVAINSAIYLPGTSRLLMLEEVYSPQLDNSRKLFIYLPPITDPGDRFPVLYMQDGFNVFDNPLAPFGSWDVNLTADALIEAGEIEPLIIVGGATNDRFNEYVHAEVEFEIGGVPYQVEPKLAEYADFLVETLKPLIDDRFPTRTGPEDTGISGSSLGGISSVWIAWRQAEVFGKVGGLSPSFWLGEESSGTGDVQSMRSIIETSELTPARQGLRIYLDSGDTYNGLESYGADSRVYTDWTRNTLIALGWPNRPEWDDDDDLDTPPADFPTSSDPDQVPTLYWSMTVPAGYNGWTGYLGLEKGLLHLVGAGHAHNEAAWRDRMGAVLRYLYPGEGLQ